MDVEVAVVGGGPVGTLLAAELALHGVQAVVLERLPQPCTQSKATNMHARTVQLLERRELLDRVGAYRGMRLSRRPPKRRIPFHFAGIFELDLRHLDLDGPPVVAVPQSWAEEVFANRAAELGARIERGYEVVDVHGRQDDCVLTVDGPTGRHELTAGYVVGADGAHSVVRKQAGIDFVGAGPTVAALMGEVLLLDPDALPVGWHRTHRGWVIRWDHRDGYSRVFAYDFRGPHVNRGAPVELDELRRSVEHIWGHPVSMTEPRWLTRFGNATLQAEHYRRGHVLVAGDAAHVHFPFGGQGLNTGLQDAMNLGWKLAAEVHGWAPEGLLETYHGERHPVAERVLWNVAAQVALMNPDPSVDPLRELFTDLMRLDQVNQYLGGMLSGLDITYDVGHPDNALAGTMAPDRELKTSEGARRLTELLHPGRPILLDLADRSELREVARGWSDRVDVVTAVPDADMGADSLLIRPDGHIAWAARNDALDTDELRYSLCRWFGSSQDIAPI